MKTHCLWFIWEFIQQKTTCLCKIDFDFHLWSHSFIIGQKVWKHFGLLRHLFAHSICCICMTRNLEGQLGALAPQTITITPEENEAIQRVSYWQHSPFALIVSLFLFFRICLSMEFLALYRKQYITSPI
jgi:hypothetical protein